VLGVCMLWDLGFGMVRSYVGWDNPIMRDIYYFTSDRLPRVVIAIAVIWFGVSLLRGKKFESAETDRRSEEDAYRKPAALPGEIAGDRKAYTGNADGQSADAMNMEEQKPDAEAQKAYGQNAEVHNMDGQRADAQKSEAESADTGNAYENEQGGEEPHGYAGKRHIQGGIRDAADPPGRLCNFRDDVDFVRCAVPLTYRAPDAAL